MAIASLTTLKTRITQPEDRIRFMKVAPAATIAGRMYSTWLFTGAPAAGVAPSTAVVPTRATTGSIGQQNPTGTRRLLRLIAGWTLGTGGTMTVIDRVSHQGGLSGIVTTAQTTNLPTAALTRKTTGYGVEMGLEVYSVVGSTGTTATASYTNHAGTAGQTSVAVNFGATNYSTQGRFLPVPLAAGDEGVQAVASVTLLASTATAGNFGVTLYYPYLSVPIDPTTGRPMGLPSADNEVSALYGGGTWFPVVDTGACISFLIQTTTAWVTNAQMFGGELSFAED